LPSIDSQRLLHQRPAPASYVAAPLEDTVPPQGGQQSFRAVIVCPEFGQVCTRFDRPFLEGGHQPVGVAPVPLLRENHHINQVGNPTAEPVTQTPDPVADLVAEYEVVLVKGPSPAGRVLLLLEELGEPGREVLVLSHLSNCELAHDLTASEE